MVEKKYRHELKYICSAAELAIIEARISAICSPDKHTNESGCYNIRSIYFDTHDLKALAENEAGVDPREKFRIRIYDGSDAVINLELKAKEHGMTHKDSYKLSKEEFDGIMNRTLVLGENADPLLTKFYSKMLSEDMAPSVIVDYLRKPYVYDIGNCRITFDMNISSSDQYDCFFGNDLTLRPIMPAGQHVLEVKYDELLPDYLYNLMNLGSLKQTSFSKYYLCKKFSI